jgi:hypothetical protein
MLLLLDFELPYNTQNRFASQPAGLPFLTPSSLEPDDLFGIRISAFHWFFIPLFLVTGDLVPL